MIDPIVAQQLEMLNRTGALAAAFLAGWVCCLISLWTGLRAMRRTRQYRLASRMRPPKGSYGLSLDRDPGWRRSFNHENTNRPSGPPPLKFRRRYDGYQPRSQGGTPNPPPSDP